MITFAPSYQWQDVPADAVLPPGLQIELDQSTGRKRARKQGGLAELAARRQWVVFRFENDKKPPYQALRPERNASATNPRTWASFEEARVCSASNGIGYALTENDRLVFIDLDKCRDIETGKLDDWTQEILDRFAGCYCEPSVSGTGVHIICRGMLPPGHTGKKVGKIEIYWRDRFMYTTDSPLPGREQIIDPPEGALRWLWAKLGNGHANDEAHVVAVEIDQSVAAVVAIKAKIDAAIENDNEFRYTWSLLRGWLKADGTPDWSHYDLSIASRLARVGLSDDEIGLAIALFRAEKCQTDEDRHKPLRHRTYLGLTIGKARAGIEPSDNEVSRALAEARRKTDKAAEAVAEAAKTARAAGETAAEDHRVHMLEEAVLEEAKDGAREAAFAWIDAQMGVGLRLKNVIRWGKMPGTVSLEFEDRKEINFGPAGDLGSLVKFKHTLLHHAERCMRISKKLHAAWPPVVELMLKHAEKGDPGDGELASRLEGLIERQVESSGAPLVGGDELYSARREYRTHVYDGHVYVFSRTLLREMRFLGIDAPMLWALLPGMGFEPKVVSTKRSSRQAWRRRIDSRARES